MKKSLLTFALLVISAIAFSQVTIKPGVRAGANIANITNTDLDNKTDFYLGTFVEIKFASFYALQPELNYTRQGGESKFSEFDDLEIQYVSFSIANKFSPFNEMGLHFIVGPAINIKVGDNFDEFSDELESFDIIIFGGLGYDFPFGLTLEARYNIGLVDIFGSNVNNEVSFDEILLNKVIQLGAAYKFDF